MGIAYLMSGEPVVLEIWNWRLLGGFWRFYRKRFLMRNFTGQIRDQDYQIDQKKLIPLITSEGDPSLTLPLVYNGPNMAIRWKFTLSFNP